MADALTIDLRRKPLRHFARLFSQRFSEVSQRCEFPMVVFVHCRESVIEVAAVIQQPTPAPRHLVCFWSEKGQRPSASPKFLRSDWHA